MPNYGDKVFVVPARGHVRPGGVLSNVLADPIAPRYLAAEGSEEVWTPHLAARLASGEIELGRMLDEPQDDVGEQLPPGSNEEKKGPALPAGETRELVEGDVLVVSESAPVTPKSPE